MLRRGFTLIELLIAITIMAIVGVAGIVSFNALMNKQDGARIQSMLETTIKQLDSYVDEGFISDYTLTLAPGKLGCIVEKNTYAKASDKKVSLSFDFETLSGKIIRSTPTPLMAEIKTQNKTRKTILSNDLQATFEAPRQSVSNDLYSIITRIDGENANIFDLLYYSPIGQIEKSEGVRLSQINAGTQTGTISNFLGKKSMKLGGTVTTELRLSFEQQGKSFEVMLK